MNRRSSMRVVLIKAVLSGLLSLMASLAICFSIVPLLGGQVDGAGLLMAIICPLTIAIPVSAVHFHQAEKLRRAEASAANALVRLARIYEELRVQSRLDGLTGIPNRQTFQKELADISKMGTPGGLLFLDLDHFKSINDRYGHAIGDEVLRKVGRLLSSRCGPGDLTGRLGGEEFVLFFGDLAVGDMFERCEEIRLAVARLDVRASTGATVRVSVSIGAVYCEAGFDAEGCLGDADRNLYAAKAGGRNTVALAGSDL
ncbi:GGDEF domain-containing protein [Rhizobium sp. BR 314]|uniref:GGDEF domain-containing protein n=1 Tax=Rhizobium sp. BR 314 TaxID=3040013 RepID=UPI0039BFDA66